MKRYPRRMVGVWASLGLAMALSFQIALAQEAPAREFAECERILNSPPINQLGKYTEDGTYGAFDDDVLTPALIGVRCSSDQIRSFMEQGGWLFDRIDRGNFSNQLYESDLFMKFYIPDESWLSKITGRKARGGAYIHFHEEKVTSVVLVPSK